MKRSSRKKLFDAFGAALREKKWGKYRPVASRDKPEHGLLYVQRHPIMNAFIYLQPHDATDTFTIEIAGAIQDQFPWTCVPDEFPWEDVEDSQVLDAPTFPCFRIRLSSLWPPYRDVWWPLSTAKEPDIDDEDAWRAFIFEESEPNATDRLETSVQDAIERLEEYGLPYLEAVRQAMATYGTRPREAT